MTKKKVLQIVLLVVLTIPLLVNSNNRVHAKTSADHIYEACSITLGENGKSHTYIIWFALDPVSNSIDDGVISYSQGGMTMIRSTDSTESILNVPSDFRPSRFVRETKGDCVFQIFNSTNLKGRNVFIGTDLSKRIRAGIGGVTGAGATWKVRSLRVTHWPRAQYNWNCKIRLGGDGIRMTFPAGNFPRVPGMNRVSYVTGYPWGPNDSVCKAQMYNHAGYESPLRIKQGPYYPSKAYDPGFRIRSIKLCPVISRFSCR